jgi:hypothetical protein
LHHSRTLRALKNPRYTGAFVYGRSQTRRIASGREARKSLPRDQWHTLLLDAHPGYITLGVVLIVGALTFFPALALGPILDHFQLAAGHLAH